METSTCQAEALPLSHSQSSAVLSHLGSEHPSTLPLANVELRNPSYQLSAGHRYAFGAMSYTKLPRFAVLVRAPCVFGNLYNPVQARCNLKPAYSELNPTELNETYFLLQALGIAALESQSRGLHVLSISAKDG